MSCLLATVFACAVVAADQPLVPSTRLISDGEAWPAASTPDGKSLLGMQKTGDHCDLVVWDTASKSKTYLVKDREGWPLAISPDRQFVAGMILSSTKDFCARCGNRDLECREGVDNYSVEAQEVCHSPWLAGVCLPTSRLLK